MSSLLQIENLTKSFGDRLLFADISEGIAQGDKIGIIAPNGSGKTTLLNIIAGKEDYDEGKLTFRNDTRVGYLEQVPPIDPDNSVMDYVVGPSLNGNDHSIYDRAKALVTQLGISDIDKKMGHLSGGQVKRVTLARILLEEPDMLILDEPTNHLDISIIEWLESYLSKQNLTLLMVTHDRYFLDKVCNKIWEIDRGNLYTYNGNYDYYLDKRQARYDAMSAELAKIKNILRKELDWIRRQPQARGGKAKARIDNFYELEEKSKVNLKSSVVNLGNSSSYIGSKIFEAKNVCKSFGDIKILDDWNYVFARYEKVGIVGENGVGKTSFIKLLLGELEPDRGSFDVGSTVRWGYYSQEGLTNFDEKKKVIDAVREIAEEVRIDEKTRLSASQFLSKFLFPPDTQQKYIYKLSGGERRRLNLAVVLMRNPNVLILDEPTNDLDIMTLSVLEDYLSNFKGCVIVVSHDRFFLDRIADHLFVFEGNGKVRDFPGDYTTYRAVSNEEKRIAKESESNVKIKKGPQNETNEKRKKTGLTYKERKEYEELDARLDVLENEKRMLETKISGGELSQDELMETSYRIAEIIDEIDAVELRILELMEKEQ